MNQEKSLNAKQVPYMDAREQVMGYTQFLKRYWARENGITLYKDPENHGGPWGRYEEISDGSFEENIVKQCGTRGTKLIKCISDLSERLKAIIDTVVGDVEISEGGYSRAREFLKKNRNRQLKLTESNIVFFILLLSETKDVNAVIKRAQEGKLEKEDRHMFGLGLYVYAGEDLLDDVVQPVDDSQKPTKQKAATTPKPEQPPVPCICARCNQPIKRVKLTDGTIMQAAEFAATHEGMCADCYKATRFNVA